MVNQRVAWRLLARGGHSVTRRLPACGGGGRLERNDSTLIFMDVQMPEMDGLEAHGRHRADERRAADTIIAMTAHALRRPRRVPRRRHGRLCGQTDPLR